MCVYYHGKVTIMVYVDDGIMIRLTDQELDDMYCIMLQEFVTKVFATRHST